MLKLQAENSQEYCVEYLEDEDDIRPWIEDYAVLNPNTGELEINLKDASEINVEPDEAKNEEEIVTRNEVEKSIAIKHSKKRWRETNKQEWFHIYKQYMQNRSTGKHTVNSSRRESEKLIRKDKEIDKKEFLEVGSDVETVEDEGDSEQCEDVEYLVEELMGHSDERTEDKQVIEPGSDMESVEDGGTSEPSMDVEYLIEELMIPADALQKERVKSFSKQGRLLHNSLKLIKNSNICIFRWTTDLFACFCCLQHFKHMSMLRAHTKNCHKYKEIRSKIVSSKQMFYKADISDLKCSICDLPLEDLYSLQRHLKIHGLKVKMEEWALVPYKLCTDFLTCQLCYEIVADKNVLQRHMKEHLLKHVCDVCNARFNNRRSLWLHKCSPIYRNKCIICEEVLKSTYARKRHESDVHGLEFRRSTYRINCKFCSQTFKHNYKRLEHVMAAHKGETSLYKCSFCPKIFMTVYWCNKHMNCVHREELNEFN